MNTLLCDTLGLADDFLGGILRHNLGEVHCESKIAARQWGVNFEEKVKSIAFWGS